MRADLVLSTEARSIIYLIKTNDGERVCEAIYLNDPLFEHNGGIIAINYINTANLDVFPWKDTPLKLPELDYYDYSLKVTRTMHGEILKTANEINPQPVEIHMRQGSGDVIYDIYPDKDSKPITRHQGTESPWLVYEKALPTATMDLERHCIEVISVDDLDDVTKQTCLRSFRIDHNENLRYKDINIISGTLEDMPLICISETETACWMKWMRANGWRDRCPTPEEIESDQEKWARKITRSNSIDKYVLSGEELLNTLIDYPETYWKIASVYDLAIGTAATPTGFTLSKNNDCVRALKKHIFTETNLKQLKTLYIVDVYIHSDFPRILKQIIGPNITTFFVIEKSKQDVFWNNYRSKPNYSYYPPLSETDLYPDYPNMNIHYTNIGTRDMHSRFIALYFFDGTWEYWELDNSLDKITDYTGTITCTVEKLNVDFRKESQIPKQLVEVLKEVNLDA